MVLRLVRVVGARRNEDGTILCSLDVRGHRYLTKFTWRGGRLIPDSAFAASLHQSGMTMAQIEPAVREALWYGVPQCAPTEDDLYDTSEAIEQRAWDKWQEAMRHEPRCLYY